MRSPTRRDALLSAALFSSQLAEAAPEKGKPGAAQDGVARSATRIRGFADPEMDFQLLRGPGVANYMGASVGGFSQRAAPSRMAIHAPGPRPSLNWGS